MLFQWRLQLIRVNGVIFASINIEESLALFVQHIWAHDLDVWLQLTLQDSILFLPLGILWRALQAIVTPTLVAFLVVALVRLFFVFLFITALFLLFVVKLF